MRTTVKAMHLGKPIVWQVEDITHFHHRDKYVTAHHKDGRELLLSGPIKALAAEFADLFIEIRRGMLIRRDLLLRVETHCDQSNGVAHVQGVGLLPCGRTRMPALRRYLKERANK